MREFLGFAFVLGTALVFLGGFVIARRIFEPRELERIRRRRQARLAKK